MVVKVSTSFTRVVRVISLGDVMSSIKKYESIWRTIEMRGSQRSGIF